MRFASHSQASADAMRLHGATEAEVEAILGPPPAPAVQTSAHTIEVWPEHEAALELLLRLRTQWRWASGLHTQRVGLCLQAADVVRRAMRISAAQWLAVLDQLHTCELAILAAESHQRSNT